MSHVYIVHCIDTEGPLTESLDANFQRLKDIFSVELEATKENLIALRNQNIDLGQHTKAIANMLDSSRTTFNESWLDIENMLNDITSKEFTHKLIDSNGNGWKYNWFCLDHVGFSGLNPRERDAGDHKVFDFYRKKTKNDQSLGNIQWHYHPLPISGHYHNSGTTYLNSSNVTEILAKKIIDRKWFPSCYRPGFHTERPDSNWFLEQWIPFDYANQSTNNDLIDQPDLADGRYGDWRFASKSWTPYHPDHDNYQKKGSMRRWVARCLNMHARLREILQKDVDEAFKNALSGNQTLLSFTNHDFRNMAPEIEKIREFIKNSSEKFPDVTFSFESADDGFRKCLSIENTYPNLTVELIKINDDISKLNVISNGDVFGPQPFLAIKTLDKKYFWENFDFIKDNHWSYYFDQNNAPIHLIDKIGVACNSSSGFPEVHVINVN